MILAPVVAARNLSVAAALDAERLVGITIDRESKQIIQVTKDILINQIKRDAPAIGESFDRLHDSDLREIADLDDARLRSTPAQRQKGF